MPRVLISEIGMQVQRPLSLLETVTGLAAVVRWKGLSNVEDTSKPLRQVFEDVPQLLHKILLPKTIPLDNATKARRALGLQE